MEIALLSSVGANIMSDKKQTARKLPADFYSEEWPYSDVFSPEQNHNHRSLTENDLLHLPAIRTEDLFVKTLEEVVIVEQTNYDKKNNFISFIGGVICASITLLLLLNPSAPVTNHDDALVLLRELSQQFQSLPAEDAVHLAAASPYKLLDGPEFIAKLQTIGADKDKLIWLEASKRRDERISITLLQLLDHRSERTKIRALLALSSSFHSEQSIVFRRIVSGIQNDFSPFVRAYATKMIIHTYGSRARKFLESRMINERDSFVLAITTRMLQSLDPNPELLQLQPL